MPYRAPGTGGLIRDRLIVHADGRVEVDGQPVGWITRLQLAPRYEYSADPQRESTEVSLSFAVVREKPEPDAVYDLMGRKVGYEGPDGRLVPLDRQAGREGPPTEAAGAGPIAPGSPASSTPVHPRSVRG